MEQRAKSNARGRRALWLLVCASALLAVGCQEKSTTVKGLVTLDGKPLAMHPGMRGTVVFQPTVAKGTTLNGVIDSHGRYELATGSSVAVTPSVYWVTVSAVEIVPPSDERPLTSGRRVTPAKYASATDSGFRIEVLPGENEVILEMTSDAAPPTTAEAAATPQPEQTDHPDPTDDESAAANAEATK